jgi:hypothetical protein
VISRVASALASAAMLLAATQPAQRQSTPVFRGGVDLITVDVRVMDKSGRPATGLGADDFQVEFDGQRRPVRALDYVEFGGGSSPLGRSGSAAGAAGNDRAIEEIEGRSILIAVDDLSFRPLQERGLTAAAAQWLARLTPRDRVGVVALSDIRRGGLLP